MTANPSPCIDHHFASHTDLRQGKLTRPLINIVTIALCATTAEADDFVALTKGARLHQDRPGPFLDSSNGIPSHDRLNMVFGLLPRWRAPG